MLLAAPRGPVVRGEGDVGVVGEQVDGLVEVARPDAGVADRRAAQGEQVVQVVRGVLGHAQRPAVGEEEVHLRRAPRCPGVIWKRMRTPSSVSS